MSTSPTTPDSTSAVAAASSPSKSRVSKSKQPANDIIPGPVSPPGHPNFKTFTRKVSVTSKGKGTITTTKLKATLAIGAEDGGGGDKGALKEKEAKKKNRSLNLHVTSQLLQVQEKNKEKEQKSEILNSFEQLAMDTSGDQFVPVGILKQSKFTDPLLPTTADSLKQYFLQNVSPNLASPEFRALVEHMLALLKAAEEKE